MRRPSSITLVFAVLGAIFLAMPAAAADRGPKPGTPEYYQRDFQNVQDAWGRELASDGQFMNPNYGLGNLQQLGLIEAQQLQDQATNPTHPALGPGNWFPGWNIGNPFRADWNGKRGRLVRVAYTNRYGALIRGTVFAPLAGARDPYTGQRLQPPFPGVIITEGSIQASERMYWWIAEDLAERGYVTMTYDVQGQGTSETTPHEAGYPLSAAPFCDPTSQPHPGEESSCDGVPSQQLANFVYGTEDAISFFTSKPQTPYKNPKSSGDTLNSFNPFWKLFDRSPDTATVTPGRSTRIGIVGHSLGATAVSYVQAVDPRVEAVVAYDKLASDTGGMGQSGFAPQGKQRPVAPALGVQSEYGFEVEPYWMEGSSSFTPQPHSPDQGPDPKREKATGFDAWQKAGVDSMVVVPRASTHLEYTDIPYVLPASRYGQDVTSWYTQAWFEKYLKHDPTADKRLLSTQFSYLEPTDSGKWKPVRLSREKYLSFYFCSAYAFRLAGGGVVSDPDIAHVGC